MALFHKGYSSRTNHLTQFVLHKILVSVKLVSKLLAI